MQRRHFLGTSGLLAASSLLAACGGGSDDDEMPMPDASEEAGPPALPADEDGYWHVANLNTLPPEQVLNTAALARPTPGRSFTVEVQIGNQAQAGVGVQIIDIHGALIDQGVTDARGHFVSQATGRHFMMAVAQSSQGTLYGFEYQNGAKRSADIQVNLVGTLLYKIGQRLRKAPNVLEYVLNTYFGSEYSLDLSDLSSTHPQLSQEQLYLAAQASGLSLDAYLDRLVNDIMSALERGDDSAAVSSAKLPWSDPDCPEEPEEPEYDASLDEHIPNEILTDIKTYWSKAGKALLGLALKKGASFFGVPWVGEAGNFILGLALPSDNPNQRAMQALERQLTELCKAIDSLTNLVQMAEHKRVLDQVILKFNQFDSVIQTIEQRRAEHHCFASTGCPTPAETAAYHAFVLTQSRALIAMQPQVNAIHNLFVGLQSVGNENVLYRWGTAFKSRKYYTSLIEDTYFSLLDWYGLRMALIHNYLQDAYVTVSELAPQDNVDWKQKGVLRKLLERQVKAIGILRPAQLPSPRMVIDLEFNLAWLGITRFVGSDDFERLTPDSINLSQLSTKHRKVQSKYDLQSLMHQPDYFKCLPQGRFQMGISQETITRFNWRHPSKNNMENSFSNYIKKHYSAETGSKAFSWGAFADHYLIPRSVAFQRSGGDKDPGNVLLSNGLKVYKRGILQFTRYELAGHVFFLRNLKSETISLASRSWAEPYMLAQRLHSFDFFPVADLKTQDADTLLPWRVYDRKIGEIRQSLL